MTKIVMSIAGLDPSGGAGTIADVKTIAAFGCFPAAAITSLTFQNTTGVYGVENQSGETVGRQIAPIIADYDIAAVKTGMLPSAEVIIETARQIKEAKLTNVVVDPVVRSTSGFDLIDDEALNSLIEHLFPLADVITPNLAETERMAKMTVRSEADVHRAAKTLQDLGARNVLIKGGHFQLKPGVATDTLFIGDTVETFDAEHIETTATHGTGCTLAAAIAANLALGQSLSKAVEIAKRFVHEAIRTSPQIGKGNSPINVTYYGATGKNTGD